ncbi:MAG: helix-turn-helix domain-containing protein [Bacteroidota bacterium]
MADDFLALVESSEIISVEVLRSASRWQYIKNIRHAVCKVLYENTNLSYKEVGRLVNRDHSTVVHSCKQNNAQITELYFELMALFVSLKK